MKIANMRIARLTFASLAASFGIASLGIGVVGTTAFGAETGAWPQRTVRLIVPFGTGTSNDTTARLFAEHLGKRWGQPVVIENQPGADTVKGVGVFASTRDDHTLLFTGSASLTVVPLMIDRLPYDPRRDLVPISTACITTIVIAATASSSIHSLADLVSQARAEPGKLTWASGPSLPNFLFAAFLKSLALDMLYVPYKETTSQITDLGQGRIHVLVTGLVATLPLHEAGKARLLAVTNKERAASFPDIPTVKDAGQSIMSVDGLSGFFGGRDMPAELRDWIAAEIRAVAVDPQLRSRLERIGQILHVGTPAEFETQIEAQRLWATELAKFVNSKSTQ
jgi:tripartite-type tricarboxylate transporter receptor subunit TctC